ncbi:MAG: SAM-dependent chlorinase/fluorinase [Haliscomenobacter sp.]|nr:SAM-dependent chlorinase/fluorinase [Haliscomenobacter sp.]MBK9489017.1 SAM-dependent chlorinase/fluorinase [Haliscomenobacter sp.]
MAIVTLTTDFGLQDYYAALVKGALLCAKPDLQIVDVSHHINNYDIVQAAFILRNTWKNFPEGTIHLIGVNDLASAEQRFLGLTQAGHFFIAPDNGVLALLFDQIEEPVFSLPVPVESSFPIKDVFAQSVWHLTQDQSFEQFAEPITDMVQRITFQPVISPNRIRGAVIYIDQYENVISNISRELFERVGQNRAFELYFKRNDPILKLNRNYYDVAVGETLCLINSADYLELAINMGKASSMLGLKLEDTIQIDFKG